MYRAYIQKRVIWEPGSVATGGGAGGGGADRGIKKGGGNKKSDR